MPPSGLFTLLRPCHLYIRRVWLWWGGQVWTVKIPSMDTLKLMPIGQPPPPFETGSVCSQAGLELSILLPQIACPLPLSYFVCMYIWTQCVGGWEGASTTLAIACVWRLENTTGASSPLPLLCVFLGSDLSHQTYIAGTFTSLSILLA